MAILDIARGQVIMIPAIRLTNRKEFVGVIRASDGETLVIELEAGSSGLIPGQVDERCMLAWEVDGIARTCQVLIRSKSSRALVVQVVIQERREAPRVRADMQVTYETIMPEQVREVADAVMTQINALGDPKHESFEMMRSGDDPFAIMREEISALRDMIGEMMVKIDHLTSVVTGEQLLVLPVQVLQPICIMNCSSTGVGFLAQEAHQAGEYLRLRLTLRTVPQTVIDCMGVIVRGARLEGRVREDGGKDEDRYDIGVRFTHIHESDRERLIHYLFKVQRRVLRDLKEARESITQQ